MSSSASLRSFACGIGAYLGTRFRMVGFVLVTAISVSTVRGSGAPVSTIWQGLQKILPPPAAFSCFPHIWYETIYRMATTFSRAYWVLSGTFFRATDLWFQALTLETCYNAHFQRGNRTTEKRSSTLGTIKGKPVWGFLKPSNTCEIWFGKKTEKWNKLNEMEYNWTLLYHYTWKIIAPIIYLNSILLRALKCKF